jgi:hypothetical protein
VFAFVILAEAAYSYADGHKVSAKAIVIGLAVMVVVGLMVQYFKNKDSN